MSVARILRVAYVLLALAALGVAGAGSVKGASPEPTVGGQLDAAPGKLLVTSNGSVPAHVVLDATVVKFDTYAFDIQPGEQRAVAFSGDWAGSISAKFTAITAGGPGDAGDLTLTLNLKPYVPPFDWTPLVGGTLVGLAFLVVLRRVRPWRYRLTRV